MSNFGAHDKPVVLDPFQTIVGVNWSGGGAPDHVCLALIFRRDHRWHGDEDGTEDDPWFVNPTCEYDPGASPPKDTTTATYDENSPPPPPTFFHQSSLKSIKYVGNDNINDPLRVLDAGSWIPKLKQWSGIVRVEAEYWKKVPVLTTAEATYPAWEKFAGNPGPPPSVVFPQGITMGEAAEFKDSKGNVIHFPERHEDGTPKGHWVSGTAVQFGAVSHPIIDGVKCYRILNSPFATHGNGVMFRRDGSDVYETTTWDFSGLSIKATDAQGGSYTPVGYGVFEREEYNDADPQALLQPHKVYLLLKRQAPST